MILRVCPATHDDPHIESLIAQFCDAGEEIKEPDVDLSEFLARQNLDDTAGPNIPGLGTEPDEEEVDHSLAHLMPRGSQSAHNSMKGRVQKIEWDGELESMSREKAAADANRGKSNVFHEDFMSLTEQNRTTFLF